MQNFRTNGSAVVEKNGNSHTYIHVYIEKYNIGGFLPPHWRGGAHYRPKYLSLYTTPGPNKQGKFFKLVILFGKLEIKIE